MTLPAPTQCLGDHSASLLSGINKRVIALDASDILPAWRSPAAAEGVWWRRRVYSPYLRLCGEALRGETAKVGGRKEGKVRRHNAFTVADGGESAKASYWRRGL